jgi:CHAT domain-containing protein
VLLNLGSVYMFIGNWDKALELYRRSLAAHEAMDDAEGASHVVVDIGAMYMLANDPAKARPFLLDAQVRMEKLHDRRGLVPVHVDLARLDIEANALSAAQAHVASARALAVEIDQRDFELSARQLDGMIAERRGDAAAALAAYRAAAAGYRETGALSDEVEALAYAAGAELKLGRPKDALATAHVAVAQLGTVVRGLSDTEGAGARSTWTRLYDVGVNAALAAGDVNEFSWFAESGRAGALLEALRCRDAVQNASLPADLLAAERTARADEAAAARAHAIALDAKKLNDIARTKKDLAAATTKRADVIAKIQREAKAAANVLYPSAAPLDEIRAALGPKEALVSYVIAGGKATALVTRKDGAKIVALGDAAAVSAAAAALALDDASVDPAAAVAKLRTLVFDPLALGPDVTRVLVSPDGPLAFVPFATLAGDREVAYVASGTTLTVLAADAARKGEGVLALGDPVYSTAPAPEAVALNRGSGRLLPLPGTRDEAKAVGTRVLLGADANETRFAAEVATSKRWRAVHLACHGLVNIDQPMQSCLALTKTDDDDGFLTALEVFRMRIPSDLVVLSACETGRGREVRGEGLVGLTRAFMFAGAPRVVVSLWKVDDQATRALMEKFHAAWKAGTPAATALRDAQTFVRSQEKWKHPAYWAAWVLWGLPQ